ncbi:MAG: hypothetical protein WC882_00900 [Candidatus Gracilibacteria bacterium]
MALDLAPFREQAQRHYETEMHTRTSRLLRFLIETRATTLRRLHIALDLEGVLVNNNFPSSLDIPSVTERLARPLSQELINLLDLYAGKFSVWTGIPDPEIVKGIIASSGLQIPTGVEIINRADYITQLSHHPSTSIVSFFVDKRWQTLPNNTPQEKEIRQDLQHFLTKIAQIYEVDLLFDDSAARHQRALCAMGLPEDAAKIRPVQPFSLLFEEQISTYFLTDTGLLKAMNDGLPPIVRPHPIPGPGS